MLRPQPLPRVRAETARIARSAFPKGYPYLAAADALGEVFVDETFAALFPHRGQPAFAPWRLALATILQFAEGLSDRQAADEDPTTPPAFTPAEAAQRVPPEQWQRTVRVDSHGKELIHFVAELSLGIAYGPDQPVRLIAATDDPMKLKADTTWYMTTTLTRDEANSSAVYTRYSLRDWVEHYYKAVKHELCWDDFQIRTERAIVRHWHLVMLAFTFRLLAETPHPAPTDIVTDGTHTAGGKSAPARIVWNETLRRVRCWLCSWARLRLYWRQWSTAPPPPELAALLDHVARSQPLESPTRPTSD